MYPCILDKTLIKKTRLKEAKDLSVLCPFPLEKPSRLPLIVTKKLSENMQATIPAINASVALMARRKFDVSSQSMLSKAFMRSTFKKTLKKFVVDDDFERVHELIECFQQYFLLK